jgi:hypothetical protein
VKTIIAPDGTATTRALTQQEAADLASYAPAVTLASRLAELAALRWARETGGVTVGGVQVATDQVSAAKITSAVLGLNLDLISAPIKFKAVSGWVELNEAQILGIGAAVAQHVQKCFAAEAAVAEALALDLGTNIESAFDAAYDA